MNEVITQSRWGLAPLIEHNWGYMSSLVAEEEPSIPKMHVMGLAFRTEGAREKSQSDLKVIQRTELEKWPNLFGGAEMIMCGSLKLKQEAVILKLSWRAQDLEMLELDITCSERLLSGNKTTQRERILLHWTKQKGVGGLRNTIITLTTDMEVQNLENAQLAWVLFSSTISSCFL